MICGTTEQTRPLGLVLGRGQIMLDRMGQHTQLGNEQANREYEEISSRLTFSGMAASHRMQFG